MVRNVPVLENVSALWTPDYVTRQAEKQYFSTVTSDSNHFMFYVADPGSGAATPTRAVNMTVAQWYKAAHEVAQAPSRRKYYSTMVGYGKTNVRFLFLLL